jgi:outer membrane receptor protein involved in Fe transport
MFRAQFSDARNIQPVSSTTTFNGGGFVRILRSPDLRLALEVKNLLDDRTLVDALGNPLPSRTVLFTLRVSTPDRG